MWTEEKRKRHSQILRNSERARTCLQNLIERRQAVAYGVEGTIPRHIAKKNGLSTYFTGRPCKHGHVNRRRTINGTCIECEDAAQRKKVALAKTKPEVWARYLAGKRPSENWLASNLWRFSEYEARRRSAKRSATPRWANREIIKMLYQIGKIYRDAGIPCHVDHIVPLRSRLVCGLHVESNLTLLPARDNIAKSNRTWPDGPSTWTRIS